MTNNLAPVDFTDFAPKGTENHSQCPISAPGTICYGSCQTCAINGLVVKVVTFPRTTSFTDFKSRLA